MTAPAKPTTQAPDTVPAAAAVLDEDTEDLLAGLQGIHPGLDLIADGARLLLTDTLDRDQAQTILAAVSASSDGTDLAGLTAALIAHLTNPDTTPCLRQLAPPVLADVRRIGADAARETDTQAPRDLVAEACARIDPYARLNGTG